MAMPVMHVRVMRMIVHDRVVTMPVHVRLAPVPRKIVFVKVMSFMRMRMAVSFAFVAVFV